MKQNTIQAAAALVILVIIAIACAKIDQPTEPEKSATDEPPIPVTAKILTTEYDENELAADGKYKGKRLAVAGKITNIAETFGSLTVSLEGHDRLQTVMCSFEEAEKASLASLKKGQNVTLIGVGDGSTGGLYVGLTECKIQQ